MSRRLLEGISGCECETGEVNSVIGFLWNTNDNLMKILSEKYTFREEIIRITEAYYSDHPATVASMLENMYVSNSVKRPIYRTLSIMKDITKVCGREPDRIFIEMARGGGEKGTRTKSRRDQINNLYKEMDKEEVRQLSKELEGKSDNELQSEVLFLYFMQLGKCAYTGTPLDIGKLKTESYNVDHIYPQCFVKDDSIDNKVLVLSEENGAKGDKYPIKQEIRNRMQPFWHMLEKNHLISEEKYKRLVRTTPFSEEERNSFINRQLVETRQSTKAVADVLRKMYPSAEIVYSKAGTVSEFRHEVLKVSKSRSVNDLHHAKDAYLNIVVGNVYHCRFTKNFYVDQKYSLKAKTLFAGKVMDGNVTAWEGALSIVKVKKVITRNNIHYTRYQFKRKGGLFDQLPVKATEGLVPRKKGLSTEKYGGYNKTTAACFMIVQYRDKGKKEVMIAPVELMYLERILSDESYAKAYMKNMLETVWKREEGQITDVEFPLGYRLIWFLSLHIRKNIRRKAVRDGINDASDSFIGMGAIR